MPPASSRHPAVRLLGAVDLVGSSGPVALGGPKARAILGMLALARGGWVGVDALVDGVWGEDAPLNVRNALQVHVAGARKALAAAFGDVTTWSLQSDSGGYRLTLPAHQVDVLLFEEAVEEADVALMRGDYPAAQARAEAALELWGGEPLSGVGDAPFAQAPRARLVDRLLVAHELRADAALACGRAADVAAALERVVAEHPFCEPLWRRLMLAMYRSGRQVDALAAYERLRRSLDDELGLDPTAEVMALHQAILRHDVSLQPAEAAEPASPVGAAPRAGAAVAGLPWFGNPLVGRDPDVAALLAAVGSNDNRLVTVLGPGGAGKTRTAVEVTRRVAESFPGPVVFVDASVLPSAAAVVEVMARALGVFDDGEPLSGLLALGTRRAFATVDNVEQFVDDLRPELAQLLQGCPGLGLLLTSRVPTGVDGETRHVLEALPLQEAVSLFSDRARRVFRGFSLDDPKAREAVERICTRLDCIPLSLELAAARLRLMPLQQLSEHLQQSVLTLSGVPAHARTSRSVRDLVDWSYRLLPADTARVLRLLSVFESGFTLDTAESVVAEETRDVLASLAELVENGLVVGPALEEVVSANAEPPRFRLLESIREFGQEQLELEGEQRLAYDGLARHFLLLLPDPDAAARDLDATIAAIRGETPNLRAAFRWLLTSEPDAAARLLLAVARAYFSLGELGFVREAGERLLETGALDEDRTAEVSALVALPAYQAGDRATALRLLARVPLLLDRPRLSYPAVIGVSYLVAALADEGRHDEAAELADRLLTRAAEAGEDSWSAAALDGVQYAARLAGDVQRAVVLARASVDAALRVGDVSTESVRREALAQALFWAGMYDEALAEADRSVELARVTRQERPVAAGVRGRVLLVRGEVADAVRELMTVVNQEQARGYASCELGWIALALAHELPEQAARALGAALLRDDPSELPQPELVGNVFDELRLRHADAVQVGLSTPMYETVEALQSALASISS